MIVEWDKAFTITTPLGHLLINQADGLGRTWRTVNKACQVRRSVRANKVSVPQGDGDILYKRFSSGLEIDMTVEAWSSDHSVAKDGALAEMGDTIFGYLWSLNGETADPSDGGRVEWTPSSEDARIIDAVRLLSLGDPIIPDDETCAVQLQFTLDTRFPYAISATEDVFAIGGLVHVPNDGNVPFYPVIHVAGAVTDWTLFDHTSGKSYVYVGTRPGAESIPGGSYAEIDMFRGGLIYLNGNQDNLKAGVDVELSDILTILPGGSLWELAGATGTVLRHDSWA